MALLKGRLGLETARVPHGDRHGIVWLDRGRLYAQDGTLHFVTKGSPNMGAGNYSLPFQTISNILIGPGTAVTHDALRLMARHGTGLIATGEDGIRFYASMPFGPDDSTLARSQVRIWGDDQGKRIKAVRRMYAWRLGEILPHADITVLRGIEGDRMKTMYRNLAAQYGIHWQGRRYDRNAPDMSDLPNQAINHSATAVEGAAMISVACTGTIPQLGFIHEQSGNAFCLDIADLFRDEVTIPMAFAAVAEFIKNSNTDRNLEKTVRTFVGQTIQKKKIIPRMIDRIKDLFDEHDRSGNQ